MSTTDHTPGHPGPYAQPAFPGGYPQPQPPAKRRRWVHFVGYPLVAIVALGIGVGVGGADTSGPGKNVAGSSPAQADTSANANADTAADTDTGSKKPDGVYGFGDTVKFEDGSTLTVAKPVRFTPSDTSFGSEKFPEAVKAKVTFKNASGKVFDPSLTTGTASSGGKDGEEIFDSAKDIGAPQAKILPGKSRTWTMGFGVEDATKVTASVNVGFLDYDDVTFTNDN